MEMMVCTRHPSHSAIITRLNLHRYPSRTSATITVQHQLYVHKPSLSPAIHAAHPPPTQASKAYSISTSPSSTTNQNKKHLQQADPLISKMRTTPPQAKSPYRHTHIPPITKATPPLALHGSAAHPHPLGPTASRSPTATTRLPPSPHRNPATTPVAPPQAQAPVAQTVRSPCLPHL